MLLVLYALLNTGCEKNFTGVKQSGPDTTSHDFEWKIYTFDSPYGSGDLYDVTIIDENDLWVVGEIYSDSLDHDNPYNALHWDGEKWEFNKVNFYTICGQNGLTVYPARSLLFCDENRIIVAMDGNEITIIDSGIQQTIICLPVSFSISKLWGSDCNDFYCVGFDGHIVRYNNEVWNIIETDTNIHFRDIWGSRNEKTGELEILAVASYMYGGRGLDLVKISGTTVEHLDTTGLSISEATLWFEAGKCYYMGGDGLFYKQNLQDSAWKKIEGLPPYYKTAIRGNNENDIFVVGAYCWVSHFNGKNWFTYNGKDFPYFHGTFNSVCFKNNLVVAVGILGPTAEKVIILKGIRN
jgi:hypothetical protein